tara:strand:+ start:31932 stop:32138 length:207 start_codon:yes stop_codon:yes gene_type:complete
LKNFYNLISGKSVIYNKLFTKKSRFYLIFDRFEDDYAIGKTLSRKTKKMKEKKIPLKELGCDSYDFLI